MRRSFESKPQKKSKLKYSKKETSVEEIDNNLLPISLPAADWVTRLLQMAFLFLSHNAETQNWGALEGMVVEPVQKHLYIIV